MNYFSDTSSQGSYTSAIKVQGETWIPSHGNFGNAAHHNFPSCNYLVNLTWICKYLRINTSMSLKYACQYVFWLV